MDQLTKHTHPDAPSTKPLTALVFAAPDCSSALWNEARYAPALGQLKDQPLDPKVRALAQSRQLGVECVREVLQVMAQGPWPNGNGIMHALAERREAGGVWRPPLLVVQGELEWLFDEAAQRAIIAAVAEAMTPAKDAAAQAAAQARTELLHQGRHYRRSKVFGGEQLQALIHLAGAAKPIPAYFDQDLASHLPHLSRFRAKLLVEVHPLQDPSASPGAIGQCMLRVVALARDIEMDDWRIQ